MAPSHAASAWLVLSIGWAWLTWNALRPRYSPSVLAALSFFAGWLTSELALHHLAVQLLLAWLFVRWGALSQDAGRVALAVSVVSWSFLVVAFRASFATAARFTQALDALPGMPPTATGEDEAAGGGVDWWQVVAPFPIRDRRVAVTRGVAFHDFGRFKLRLDVFRAKTPPGGGGGGRGENGAQLAGGEHGAIPIRAPALVYVHGGAWMIGRREEQGLPLLLHMAARGWVCFSVSYRLSPRATFPDHIVDVKRALAFIHARAAEYGIDEELIAIAGGSAGGHLAALAALTAGRPEYQPGFEQADTRVAACVPFYGIYDFTNRYGHWPHAGLVGLLARTVMKRTELEDPEGYRLASPVDQIHAGAPPFLVVHGTHDSMVPVAEARRFVDELKAVSRQPAVLVEVPGAQHAFEIFPSLRTELHLRGVARFLGWLRAR